MKKIILNESQLNMLFEITISDIEAEMKNVDLNPTDPQKDVGNYKMGHISIKGMGITIENPRGSVRKFKDSDGNEGTITMRNHYGYFRNTRGNGKDGDAVDVFLGPHIENFDKVYVIDQNNKDGEFDESKVMIGFLSKEEAKRAYLSNYDPSWRGFRTITAVNLKTFKKWLYRGNKQRKPFAEYVYIQKKKLEEEIQQKEQTQTVYFLVGLPGSGKSTWCKTNHPDLPIASRDIIRAKLGFTKNTDEKARLEPWQEEHVTKVEYSEIKKHLESGQDFIIDDTNLRTRFRRKMIETLRKHNVRIVGVVFNTPLGTCIERRKGQIDGEILQRMHDTMDELVNDEVDDIIKVG